jgi:hypothetical protein
MMMMTMCKIMTITYNVDTAIRITRLLLLERWTSCCFYSPTRTERGVVVY